MPETGGREREHTAFCRRAGLCLGRWWGEKRKCVTRTYRYVLVEQQGAIEIVRFAAAVNLRLSLHTFRQNSKLKHLDSPLQASSVLGPLVDNM